ncbi:MarR family transcriptional regulator [Nocardioides sp. GY 10127]|uniref:MarR family winged helix-turn-helix transcriptional regulator n=1 Tax=Nocardioides sp. GY 10127 TaxID=2569762 RepID=UPI0010A7651C|nr:MarR family transcriptional regulator [Nocardioides sp. GY 10127]TIC79997.1 MarR family transcriptional regulator [Nocardioides sp. GY 10127]
MSDTPGFGTAGHEDDEVAAAILAEVPGADVLATVVCFDIIRAADRLQQDFEVSVHRPAGLTWAAFRNMFALLTLGPQTPHQLAQIHSVSQASTSSIVKNLEKNGLVERERSARDGRSVTISLTERGKDVCRTLFRLNNARETAWASSLTSAEQMMLVQLLTKVRSFPVPDPPTPADRLV